MNQLNLFGETKEIKEDPPLPGGEYRTIVIDPALANEKNRASYST